jgi:putative transcription factor
MNCEMCGDSADSLITIMIEGTEMRVCKKCARFGVPRTEGRTRDLTRREKVGDLKFEAVEGKLGGEARHVFDAMIYDLAEDYNARIRKARETMGLTQEELAKRLNEKKSIVTKLETGDIRPDEKTMKKLERILGIDLKESYEEI